MECQVVERNQFTVVGIDYPEADERPDLILYHWVALASKMHLIPNKIHPEILYGVWYRKNQSNSEPPSYLVGVEVSDASGVPAGMNAVTIPASRYAALIQRGHLDFGRSYEFLMKWITKSGYQPLGPRGVTFEQYDTGRMSGVEVEVLICDPIV